MRIAERYRPGVTPIASLKVRQKWNRLTIALLAMSARDKGSLYFSYMNLIARSWALFIYLLSRVAQVICGFGCRASELPVEFFLSNNDYDASCSSHGGRARLARGLILP